MNTKLFWPVLLSALISIAAFADQTKDTNDASLPTEQVRITEKRPAELNLRLIHVIAMSDISGGKGSHPKDIGDRFTTVLVNSGYFTTVLDRENLAGVMKEQKLSMSGVIDDDSVVAIGKMIGASVLVFGTCTKDDYKEVSEHHHNKFFSTSQNRNVSGILYVRKGTYSITLHVHITDAQTAKIIGSKDFVVNSVTVNKQQNKPADPIDIDELYENCAKQLTSQFAHYVVPHNETFSVQLEKDGELPEVTRSKEFLERGEYDQIIDAFAKSAQRPFLDTRISAKAAYNYGMVLVYSKKYEDGIRSIQRAIQINPDDPLYADGLKMAETEPELAKKLQEELQRK